MATDVTSSFGTYALSPHHAQLLRFAQSMPVSWIGRRAALILRKAVLAHDIKIIDAVVEQLSLRLYMTDNVSERKFLFMPQFFDHIERRMMTKYLQKGGVFVDIGANAGIYSLTAAGLTGPSGHVLSIEPNPQVLDRLTFNMSLNGFEHQMHIEQSAVSDSAGFVDLLLDDSNLGGASLVTERSAQKITVAAHTLLSIVMKHHLPRIDAMKADIEGAEDTALVPFFKEAPEHLHPRLLIVENSVSQWKLDLQGILAEKGYRPAMTTRMNLVFEKPQ